MGLNVVTVADLTDKEVLSAMVTEPMQMYRIVLTEFDGNTLDGGHVRSAKPGGAGRAANVPGLLRPPSITTPGA